MSDNVFGPAPTVGVGLPVYNGENYLAEAIESLLAQTFDDFEVLICDNASTDTTPDICRRYAAKDERIRYVRNRSNLGGGPNINRVYQLSRGRYFKLANHDDVCAPTFLERCVEVLDANPAVVCAYPSTIDIDEQGDELKRWSPRTGFESADPAVRCWEALQFTDEPFAMFGVMRADVNARTGGAVSAPSGDKVWLAELLMHGPFVEVREPLFFHREHRERSVQAAGRGHASMAWWNPQQTGFFRFPYWRMFADLAKAIQRSPLTPAQRLGCYRAMLRWVGDNDHHLKLIYDAALPARPLIDRLYASR